MSWSCSHFVRLNLAVVFASAMLCACSAAPLPDQNMQTAAGYGGGNLTLPVTSMAARKFKTVVRQNYDFSCGSAALATLLSFHYQDRQDEAAVFRGMWAAGNRTEIRKLGFSLLDMKRYLQSRGMDGEGYRVSLAQLEKAKVSGIALTTARGYRHFIVIKGVIGEIVLVGDPARGLYTVEKAEFAKHWNGIYFIISRTSSAGVFNGVRDWQLSPRAHTAVAADPLSLQALGLVAPNYGEF